MNKKSHIKMRKKATNRKTTKTQMENNDNNGTIMQTISFHYKNKKNKDSKITSNIMSAKPTSSCLSLKFSELYSRTNLMGKIEKNDRRVGGSGGDKSGKNEDTRDTKTGKKQRKIKKERQETDEKEGQGDERAEKVMVANWEAWLYLLAILWSHSSVVMTQHSGLCVCTLVVFLRVCVEGNGVRLRRVER